jgi:hypothetical protein
MGEVITVERTKKKEPTVRKPSLSTPRRRIFIGEEKNIINSHLVNYCPKFQNSFNVTP